MRFKNIIKVAYLAYTFYAILIIDVTSLKSIEILPAVIVMWLMYGIYSLGSRFNSRKIATKKKNILNPYTTWIGSRKKSTIFLISLLSVVSSVSAAYFYTGQSPMTVVSSFFDGSRSLYSEYQMHALNNNISTFTITKIPFILMMFYTKLIFFYISISFTLRKNKMRPIEKTSLVMVAGSHIYFGLARGTNYELFELVILVIFIIMSRPRDNMKKKVFIKKYLAIFISIGIMIFLFYSRISARGFVFDYTINKDFIFEPKGIVSIISNNLAFVIILLYDYFGFGFYYVSNFIGNIWLASLGDFISGLIPIGFVLQKNEIIQDIIRQHITMSTRWHPDIIILINNLGIIGTLMLLFVLGIFTKFVISEEPSALVYLTQFMILVQMVSLPIGNFIFVSSASRLIVMLLVIVWFWKLIIKKRIKI